jgi:crotonobetainyl-CoA:carnitine CoA-transferase CaiB-like acyl-CoA transferase
MSAKDDDHSLLGPYRVLDLTDDKGLLCGKLMGDMGADVIKIERPGGDPSRDIGPFYHDEVHPAKSLYWFALNLNKRGITLDIESDEGREGLKRLVKTADFLIESFPPGYMDGLGLGYEALEAINPRLIMVSITPFGQTGPYANYKASDIVGMAMGGLMQICGDPDRPPVRISYPQAYFFASAEGVVGAMAAHYYRETTGRGQHVDVSMQQSIIMVCMTAPATWEMLGINVPRAGSTRFTPRRREDGSIDTVRSRTVWPTRDGYVQMHLIGGAVGATSSRALVEAMDGAGMATEELKRMDWEAMDFDTITQDEIDSMTRPVEKYCAAHATLEIYEEAVKRRILLAALSTVRQLLENPQLQYREAWQDVEHSELKTSITYPGAWARLTETPLILRRRAPLIGEHNHEIYEAMSGVSDEKPTPMQSTGTIRETTGDGIGEHIFEGVKAVDFGWVGVGPVASQYLARHGATVVRVESSLRPETLRTIGPYKDGVPGLDRTAFFPLANSDKYGISLNLDHPKGREVAKRLVKWADVITSGYTPGVMERWGLGYEACKRLNHEVIMLSTCMQGQTGPHKLYRGYGGQMGAIAGFNYITGWHDREPSFIFGAYTDFINLRYTALLLMAALDCRRRTGKGQFIDQSQFEGALQFLAPPLLDYTVNQRVIERMGNRDPFAAPHGAYPCRGEDRWCVIAVFTEEEWRSFCRVIGDPEWIRDPRFATLSARKENEDELDKLVADWTKDYTPEQVMAMLQKEMVIAGPVHRPEDLYTDPQIKHRQHFVSRNHKEIGPHLYQACPYILSKTPSEIRMPAPCLGEHNEYVLKELLGMSDDEISDLVIEGALE